MFAFINDNKMQVEKITLSITTDFFFLLIADIITNLVGYQGDVIFLVEIESNVF